MASCSFLICYIMLQFTEYLINQENNTEGKIEQANKLENIAMQIDNQELMQLILEHIQLQVQELGENTGIKEMRKHLTYYLKGLKDASEIRQKVNTIETKEKLIACLTEYFQKL